MITTSLSCQGCVLARVLAVLIVVGSIACYGNQHRVQVPAKEGDVVTRVEKTEAEWRELLTEEQYRVLREAGTEHPFRGAYWKHKKSGVYHCVGCGQALFPADTKFDSGTGWPSFRAPVRQSAVDVFDDDTLATMRTEVRCSRCGGHLGHVFDDGSRSKVLRYCINSVALRFMAAH